MMQVIRQWALLGALAMAIGASLAGCALEPFLGPVAAVEAGTTAVLGRGVIDSVYSAATGRDCSLANAAREGRYCAREDAATTTRYCTRSLGTVDCWTEPNPYGPQRGVADVPTPPTQQHRTWLGRW
jgi:hypothetical protein